MAASRKREFTVPKDRERAVRRDARGRFIGYDDRADDEVDRDLRGGDEPDFEFGRDDDLPEPTLH